jgi:phospholipase C
MQRKFSAFTGMVLGLVVSTTMLAPAQELISTSSSKTVAPVANAVSGCSGEVCFTSFGHNFGSEPENSSNNYGVQLTNGTSSAFPFSVSVTGSSHFTSATNCGTSVAAGASCEIVFTYTTGSTPESDTATIAVPTNGFTFNVPSSGTLNGQTVGTTTGAITVNTIKHNFTGVPFGTVSAFDWNITNATNASQAISFTPSGDTTDFTSQTNCPATLAVGQSCIVAFVYLPNSTSYQQLTETLNTSANVYVSGGTTPGNTLTLLGYGTGTLAANKAIQHVVVIFGENISFDHYFGTYPNAANTDGTTFTALPNTPIPNNYVSNPSLLTNNPNASNSLNGNGATNPFRLSYVQYGTADQSHSYTPEQEAADNGKMDAYPYYVGTADTTQPGATGYAATKALTLGYYDGNVVTALWNYAQHYAMNDNSYGTNYGPSTPGAVNVISGQLNGVTGYGGTSNLVSDGNGGYTLYGDDDPYGDTCSTGSTKVRFAGKNIGDLLNSASITWGAFMGGFNLSIVNPNNSTGCSRSTLDFAGANESDYIQHHAWFQYYASTINPTHARPTGTIGTTDAANHEYDTLDFFSALSSGVLPTVSFLKAQAYQDAHAGYSDPLDEQAFVVKVVNALEQSPFWGNTAVIIAYDDSDGWYDHQYQAPVNGSFTVDDALNGTHACGVSGTTPVLEGENGVANAQGRCGYGPRLPLVVISPWAKANYIDNTLTDQSSVLRFIEDTYLGGERIGNGSFDAQAGTLYNMFDFAHSTAPNATPVILNPTTGAVVTSSVVRHAFNK